MKMKIWACFEGWFRLGVGLKCEGLGKATVGVGGVNGLVAAVGGLRTVGIWRRFRVGHNHN